MLYFTSDLHLGHANVIRLASRPFECIEEMNERLIANINATVNFRDTLWILGDASWRIDQEAACQLLGKIRCQDIRLVRGNHDKNWETGGPFSEVCDYKVLKEDKNLIVLFHYPILSWNGMRHNARQWNKYSVHLHGHIHSRGPDYNLENFAAGIYRYDVGVDANDYRPVALPDIFSLIDEGA